MPGPLCLRCPDMWKICTSLLHARSPHSYLYLAFHRSCEPVLAIMLPHVPASRRAPFWTRSLYIQRFPQNSRCQLEMEFLSNRSLINITARPTRRLMSRSTAGKSQLRKAGSPVGLFYINNTVKDSLSSHLRPFPPSLTMLPSQGTLFAAALVAVHCLSHVAAEPHAENPIITPAPTPTQAFAARQVAGGSGTPILSTLTFPYTALPSQVYPFPVLRGPQFGYNQCGVANASATANCQTLVINNASDFCLWGSPDPNGDIGDVEAKVVSYCTNPEWGGRPIPAGSIHGLQFMRTSAYIQIVGFIDNTALGLGPTDQGGELDPHGADLQGNPLGGVVYSLDTNFSPDGGKTPGQVHNWNLFVGGGVFCVKACFNSITSPDYCQNVYDLVGCEFNMPNALQNGTYLDCEGDLQTPVGTYVTNGQTLTWSMPDPLTTDPPYTPVTPSSSQCTTFSSQQLFAGGSAGASSSGPGPTSAGASPNSSGGGVTSGAKTGSGTNPSATGNSRALASANLPTGGLLVVVGSFFAGATMLF